jgi:hypothetical protein
VLLEHPRRPQNLAGIVTEVLLELKEHIIDPDKHHFEKTIVWTRTLNDMSKFKKLSRSILGKFEYYPPYTSNTCRVYTNQAVALYWSGHDLAIKDHVLRELLDPRGRVLLVFASPALSTGVDVAGFIRSIHLGLPSKLVHLFKSIGRVGRGIDGAVAIIYANGRDIPWHKKKKTEKQLSCFASGGKTTCKDCRGAICLCSCV